MPYSAVRPSLAPAPLRASTLKLPRPGASPPGSQPRAGRGGREGCVQGASGLPVAGLLCRDDGLREEVVIIAGIGEAEIVDAIEPGRLVRDAENDGELQVGVRPAQPLSNRRGQREADAGPGPQRAPLEPDGAEGDLVYGARRDIDEQMGGPGRGLRRLLLGDEEVVAGEGASGRRQGAQRAA